MTELSAIDVGKASQHGGLDGMSGTVIAMSLLLIVGLPTVFWVSVLELANYALSIGLSNTARLTAAGTLIGVLMLIWGFIVVGAHRRRTFELEANL